jgi:hypothetical protein
MAKRLPNRVTRWKCLFVSFFKFLEADKADTNIDHNIGPRIYFRKSNDRDLSRWPLESGRSLCWSSFRTWGG